MNSNRGRGNKYRNLEKWPVKQRRSTPPTDGGGCIDKILRKNISPKIKR
jgi:hypothetical protein